ncbi:MAG: UDP-glucose/GDP-mannose dehydrogenase family protein [Candidatus Eisenbacteria bacterium]
MNIAVIGTGYVGLVTGVVFADLGNDVICVDRDSSKIDLLNSGVMPIYEPGLEEIVSRNVHDQRLSFSTDVARAVQRSEVVFIAVGTPPAENGETDLSQVKDAARDIGRALDSYKVIVNKSTVPVGTGDLVKRIVQRYRNGDTPFDVVSNPEFLREGSAILDTLTPDRIVIGAPNKNVAMTLLELYASLGRPMLITDVHSAEIIKYASNSFLATKISFANAIADLCERVGANVVDVIRGVGADTRIGDQFLQAGLGYGGSCLPKDVQSLVHTSAGYGYRLKLLEAVHEINAGRVKGFLNRMKGILGPLDRKTVCIWGLAFKPNTDDIRDAKSVEIIASLLAEGATIRAYDPAAAANTRRVFPQVTYCEGPVEAAEGADAAVVVTEWNEFRLLNMDKIRTVMKRPLIFDGRNIYDPERMKKLGFEYHSVGRASGAASEPASPETVAPATARI